MKNTTLKIFVAIISLALISCEKIKLEESFPMKVGKKLRVDYDLSFAIDSVNDYRCPLLYECIWAGDVKVLVTFYKPFNPIDTAIYLNNGSQNPIKIGGYNFKILSVNPQSQSGEIISQKDYTIELMVQKD
jgi:hypothetical protein